MKVIICISHLSIALNCLQRIIAFLCVILCDTKIFQLTSGLNLLIIDVCLLCIDTTQNFIVTI